MTKHVLSVCIFCFLCATHTPCSSHAEVTHKNVENEENYLQLNEPIKVPTREKLKEDDNDNFTITEMTEFKDTISFNKSYSDKYMKNLFYIFGNGDTMNFDDFERLLKHIDLIKDTANAKLDVLEKSNNLNNKIEECVNQEDLFKSMVKQIKKNNKTVKKDAIYWACPVFLYRMIFGSCLNNVEEQTPAHLHLHEHVIMESNKTSVWLFSTLAVVLISACGIFGLAVIPIMQKRFYQPLLQFLVALAVGTLAGDALLHLLPHAMSGGHQHQDEHLTIHSHGQHAHETDDGDMNMWKGFAAMLGLIFFFMMERIIMMVAKWRKKIQLKEKLPSRLKVMKADGTQANSVERQCKHKYSSFPMCYEEITMLDAPTEENVFRLATSGGVDGGETHNNTATTTLDDLGSNSDVNSMKISNNDKLETNQNMTECPNERNVSCQCNETNKMLSKDKEETNSLEYTVILREHENRHHGHSHMHGHVHSAPKTMSSVAWMVVMGDGLHNFTDGMAIGAAFASGTAGGFSTAVAVFCHELPHELGDFAMLLKAGMTMKQALFYNLLSSVLCLIGNICGVLLGNTEYASQWIFAAASGMFLYIALVDMIPELSSGHEDEGTLIQIFLHLTGLILGFAIMAVIALYEHDLKHMFHDTI